MNVSMNPNYIEDLNGSDYVCMTRSTPQSASKLAALNPIAMNSTNNHRVSPTNSTAATNSPAMQLTSKNLQTLQQEHLNASNRSQLASSEIDKASSTSPTPSQLSNNSNKRKLLLYLNRTYTRNFF